MRFLRHVQKLRIQLYLQNATCYAMPPVSAKRESRTRANRSDLYQHSLLSFDWSHTDIVNVTERNVFLQADSQEVSECEGGCVSLKGFPLLHSFFRSPSIFPKKKHNFHVMPSPLCLQGHGILPNVASGRRGRGRATRPVTRGRAKKGNDVPTDAQTIFR